MSGNFFQVKVFILCVGLLLIITSSERVLDDDECGAGGGGGGGGRGPESEGPEDWGSGSVGIRFSECNASEGEVSNSDVSVVATFFEVRLWSDRVEGVLGRWELEFWSCSENIDDTTEDESVIVLSVSVE